MKKVIMISIMVCILSSCATTRVTTEIGTRIGTSFQEVAKKGAVNAEKSIKAWPYVSGQLKGLMAANFDYELSKIAYDIIRDLDKLSKKDVLTDEDKGFVIGSFVRLETIAIKDSWDRYGVSISALFMQMIGG